MLVSDLLTDMAGPSAFAPSGPSRCSARLISVRDLLTEMASAMALRLPHRVVVGEIDARQRLADGDGLRDGLGAFRTELVVAEIDARQGLADGYCRSKCFCRLRIQLIQREVDARERLADGYGLARVLLPPSASELVLGEVDACEGLADGHVGS